MKYVSRAGNKLASVYSQLQLDFRGTVILDVGSSTGGFTDFSLRQGAKKVIAVDAGTHQLHDSLRGHDKVELHEKTDIRDFQTAQSIDVVLIDVSFISLKEILPAVRRLCSKQTLIVALLKPQFEALSTQKTQGIIKNNSVRRSIIKDFELWAKQSFVIHKKADSAVAGAEGNTERFYVLKKL